MNRRPNCKCSVCEKEIYRRPKQIAGGPVFCGHECMGKSLRRDVTACSTCGAEVKGRRNYCSKSCASKARKGMTYKKNVPYLHRSIAIRCELAELRGGRCERCGHDNFATLQVHHVVEQCNGGTDEVGNLELLCSNCHTEHHLGCFTYEEWKSSREEE